jgi:ketosteroid isomerase-like protein
MNEGNAEDFVRRFVEFWRAPDPERLDTVLAERVRLSAPMVPTTHTLADGKRSFADLFELIADMTAEVHRWGATEDGVLIEFTVSGTAGGGPVSWRVVDRFTLGEDGLATERETYFDSLPLVLTLARRPRAWPGFARSRIQQARR